MEIYQFVFELDLRKEEVKIVREELDVEEYRVKEVYKVIMVVVEDVLKKKKSGGEYLLLGKVEEEVGSVLCLVYDVVKLFEDFY